MEKLNNLGSFTGKVGEMVAYEVHGKTYIKQKPVRKAPLTEGERKQVNIFTMVQKWVNPISSFLRLGYHNVVPNLHALNAAKSAIHKTAVNREGEPYIVPELVKVSVGSLALSEDLDAILVGDRELNFLWDDSASSRKNPRDRIIMLAYNPVTESAFMDTSGFPRSAGYGILNLGATAAGTYHLYAAFIAEDQRSQSDSAYLGTVTVDPLPQ